MRSPMPLAPILLACLLWACLDGSPTSPDGSLRAPPGRIDGGPPVPPPAVLGMTVRDFRARVWPAEAAPQRPRVELSLSAPLAALADHPPPALLLRGAPDEALRDDLARLPLRRATEGRLVPCELAREGTRWTLVPVERLEPGAPYAVAVGPWARDEAGRALAEPFLAALRVAPGTEGGSRVTDTWPADGTAGVPPEAPLLAVRFDGEVEELDGVHLVGPAGAPHPAHRQTVLCELVGWARGRCLVLRPALPLPPGADHRWVVPATAVDPTGAPVGPFEARFRTGLGADTEPPSLEALPCGLDEEAAAAGCLLADDRSLTLRLRASEPVRLWLVTRLSSDSTVAPRGEATLRLEGLPPGLPLPLSLRAVDLAGLEATFLAETATTPPLAPVAITEVRADPRGPEPQQEYVEVANLGADPVDLLGFTLSDRADRLGDRVERSALLPAAGRALLVADGFDPHDPADDPVPPGVPLIRLGSSLGSGGLANAGEPLFLRDAEGRRVSAAPALPAPGAGACIVRIVDDPRRGDAAAFAPDAALGCTPGREDRLP